MFLLVLGREWSFILRGTDSDHTYQFVVHEGRCTCELTRVYLPKVRHRQTFEAANFCTPLGQGGSTLGAQTSVYGALFLGKKPIGEIRIWSTIGSYQHMSHRPVNWASPKGEFFQAKVRHRQTFEHRGSTLPGREGCKSWRPQTSVYGALLANIHEWVRKCCVLLSVCVIMRKYTTNHKCD